ncbi:MAG: hypothetical protein CMN30_03140 [Sandaracinus sp.]|nr:hypothetical protein [Sandaracinus sp.]
MRRIFLVTALCTSLVGCGFVRDLARDPVGTAFELADPVLEPLVPYVLDGALTVLVLALHVVAGDMDYEGNPVWICYATCDDSTEVPPAQSVGSLDCVNCAQDDGALHFATDEAGVVVPAEGWWVEELGTEGAFGASFESAGDTAWTWTDGETRFEQTIRVRDAVDVAVFDLTAGNVEIDALELAAGESHELEILPVDAEGHVLAALYEAASAGDLATTERTGFVAVDGWDETGTVSRVTATATGTGEFTVRVAGLERVLPLTVR